MPAVLIARYPPCLGQRPNQRDRREGPAAGRVHNAPQSKIIGINSLPMNAEFRCAVRTPPYSPLAPLLRLIYCDAFCGSRNHPRVFLHPGDPLLKTVPLTDQHRASRLPLSHLQPRARVRDDPVSLFHPFVEFIQPVLKLFQHCAWNHNLEPLHQPRQKPHVVAGPQCAFRHHHPFRLSHRSHRLLLTFDVYPFDQYHRCLRGSRQMCHHLVDSPLRCVGHEAQGNYLLRIQLQDLGAMAASLP